MVGFEVVLLLWVCIGLGFGYVYVCFIDRCLGVFCFSLGIIWSLGFCLVEFDVMLLLWDFVRLGIVYLYVCFINRN